MERKFEVDSLLYPIWFADRTISARRATRSIFTPEVDARSSAVLATLRDRAAPRPRVRTTGTRSSPRRHAAAAVRYTGMVWTGFRPSDDPARYQYNIPDEHVRGRGAARVSAAIAREVWHDNRDGGQTRGGLSSEIQRGIEQYGKLDAADRSAASTPTKSTAAATST